MYVNEGSIADQVQRKFKTTLKWYCEKKGLSYESIKHGYISKRAAKILKRDGITIENTEKVA